MINKYDVLIVGGGLVGASLACALEPLARLHSLKIAIVEPHPMDQRRVRPPSFDARSSALSYGTRLAYEQLNLWAELEISAACIKQVHVSDRGHYGITRLNHKSENVPALGYVIDNYILGDVLLKRVKNLRKQHMIAIHEGAEVLELKPCSKKMTATIRDAHQQHQTIKASLVVLADGGRSGLMEQLGISKHVYNYKQHALITNVSVDKPHHNIAYERFIGEGAMALLPKTIYQENNSTSLQNNGFGLVWTLSDDELQKISTVDESVFLQELQQKFGYRAGRFLQCGQRKSYPLKMSIAKEQVRPNLVILGNAAHAIHPVAGQGYNLSIRDVMALADNITASVIAGKSAGDLNQLMFFLRKQEADQKRTIAFCDGLMKLFSRQEPSIKLARNLGLLGLDFSSSLKSRFAKAAMGL